MFDSLNKAILRKEYKLDEVQELRESFKKLTWISISVRKVQETEGDEAKARSKRIIAYSGKDNLIHHVSSLKTPKEVFNALTKLFEGKNINNKMTLRKYLKNKKIQKSETIQSYFTWVVQIKEQLEVVEENVEGEIVMTTLNDLPKIMGFIHSRDLFKKEDDLFQQAPIRMHTRRISTHNKRREGGRK